MDVSFSGEVWYWRGPSPFHFVTVPDESCPAIEHAAPAVTYGWGMVPCKATLGATTWKTALWPKDGRYILGLKADVRRREKIDLGDVVSVRVDLDV